LPQKKPLPAANGCNRLAGVIIERAWAMWIR